MAYLGRQPVLGNFVKLDAITVVNGQAAYTMQNGGVNFTDYTTVNQFLVSLNGVIQAPTSSFTVSGSTITFASNLSTGDVINFIIVFGNSLSAGTVSDSAITTAKLADSSVSLAKLTATGTKSSSTFLRGDNTFDTPPLGGITMADQWRLTSNKSNVGTSDTTIDSNLERIDTSGQNTIGTAMSESSGVFTFPSTGVYYVRADMVFTKDASRRAVYVTIRSGSTDLSQSYSHINPPTGDDAFASVSASTYFNVGNTTNDTIYFRGTNVGGGDVNALGSTTKNLTTFTFIRLGDN